MNDTTNERAKKLGKLIQDARLYAERSTVDCANVLGVSQEKYEKAETGEYPISLPDLETLALYLKVPMGYFWGSEELTKQPHTDYHSMIDLRHRVIGVLLRQGRIKARNTVQDLAAELGVNVARIEAYEAGEEPVPYLHLEKLSQLLDIPLDAFIDDERGPLGRHEAEQSLLKHFKELSPELQTFIANPRNTIYLETAQKLSEMEVDRLRRFAEDLLEITW